LLPEDKVSIIEESVIIVGDGINDAPALTNYSFYEGAIFLDPKFKTSALQSNGHIENTTKEDNEFEPRINVPHERVLVVDDEQLKALPENEEVSSSINLGNRIL
jgi:hypothetical protein